MCAEQQKQILYCLLGFSGFSLYFIFVLNSKIYKNLTFQVYEVEEMSFTDPEHSSCVAAGPSAREDCESERLIHRGD